MLNILSILDYLFFLEGMECRVFYDSNLLQNDHEHTHALQARCDTYPPSTVRSDAKSIASTGCRLW